jgi:hypothetical protein
MGPSPDALIPEQLEFLQSDQTFFSYERTNIFTVNATT